MLLNAMKRAIGLNVNTLATQSGKVLDLDDPKFTDDWWKLSSYAKQNFFVYNQFMRGCHGYQDFLAGHVDHLSSAFTFGNNFVLWKKDLGLKSQAFAFRLSPEQLTGPSFNLSSWFGKPHRILGKLYSVDTIQIPKLDTELQNGVMYKRERVTVNIPYARKTKLSDTGISDVEIVEVDAWMYIARFDYWAELMSPNDKRCQQVRTYKSTADGDPYYFYSEANEQTRRK